MKTDRHSFENAIQTDNRAIILRSSARRRIAAGGRCRGYIDGCLQHLNMPREYAAGCFPSPIRK